MVEKNIQTIFGNWVEAYPPLVSTAWELKLVKGPSIAFDRVADHQIESLMKAKHGGLYYKISDSPFGHSGGFRFHAPRPLDCVFVLGEAYVVVVFYEPRKRKEAIFIDVDNWVAERGQSVRKSLARDRARQIATKIEEL